MEGFSRRWSLPPSKKVSYRLLTYVTMPSALAWRGRAQGAGAMSQAATAGTASCHARPLQ